MHDCLYRVRAILTSKRTRIIRPSQRGGGGAGGGRVYEIKTLRSNLAPEEGGEGVYSRGAYNRASTVIIIVGQLPVLI